MVDVVTLDTRLPCVTETKDEPGDEAKVYYAQFKKETNITTACDNEWDMSFDSMTFRAI